ncbi:hypothetical protein L1887_28856 [Cichorium endivia]|nr:hypothetical protein L1887_28856 [Cichorium endivia]
MLLDVDLTLLRYLRDNIPIESFYLNIEIENQESASHVEKWIRPVATKTCLKELFLSIDLTNASLTLPDDILSGENLTNLRVSVPTRGTHSVWMSTPVIKCVSLQELHLYNVCISEEALHDILSSCSLLVKIELLYSCKEFKTIKAHAEGGLGEEEYCKNVLASLPETC